MSFRPEINLIAKVMAAVAIELICHNVDDKDARIVAALQGAEAAESIASTAMRLESKQGQDVENGDLPTKNSEVDSWHL